MADILFHSWLRQVGPDVPDAERKAGLTTKGGKQVGDLWKSEEGWIAVLAPKEADTAVSPPHARRADAVEWVGAAYEGHVATLAADPERQTLHAIRTRNGMKGDKLVALLEEIEADGSGFYIERDGPGCSVAMRLNADRAASLYRSHGDQGLRDNLFFLEDADLADRLAKENPRDVMRCEDVILRIDEKLYQAPLPRP